MSGARSALVASSQLCRTPGVGQAPTLCVEIPLAVPSGLGKASRGPHGELLVGGIWAGPTERVGPLLEAVAGKVGSLAPAGPLRGLRKGRAVGPPASSRWGPGLGGDLWESSLAGRMGLSGLPWAAGLGWQGWGGGTIRVSSGVWDLRRLSCGWLVEWTGAGGLPASSLLLGIPSQGRGGRALLPAPGLRAKGSEAQGSGAP